MRAINLLELVGNAAFLVLAVDLVVVAMQAWCQQCVSNQRCQQGLKLLGTAKLPLGRDELHANGRRDGLGQQFLHNVLAQQGAEFEQRSGAAWQGLVKVRAPMLGQVTRVHETCIFAPWCLTESHGAAACIANGQGIRVGSRL